MTLLTWLGLWVLVAGLAVLALVSRSEAEDLWGDVDCNGEVNSIDALEILRYAAGLREAGCVAETPGYWPPVITFPTPTP